MTKQSQTTAHTAADAALGFWYQSLYALLSLWREQDDDSAVFIEKLDDITLLSNGLTLLEQLKHSLSANPPSITIKSVPLWKTLKAWIDILPSVEISQTRFNLVTVASIQDGSPLEVLVENGSDRTELITLLDQEAKRVCDERAQAKLAQEKKLPHTDRAPGCKAYLALDSDLKVNFIDRILLKPKQVNIRDVENELVKSLTGVTEKKRPLVAQGLVEWWDRQVLYSMCGKRSAALTRFELVRRHMEIISEIEFDNLSNQFATLRPPASYQPNSMIQKQIELVNGTERLLNRAIREEWRARETRSIWSTENPSRHDLITRYDERLVEEWSDRHQEMCENCNDGGDEAQKSEGLNLLNWSHQRAPVEIEPISSEVTSPYYIRGSYQVLSTTGSVGWHPNYRILLGFDE